ncbi:hypothetical protein BJV78DRAFT_1247584 [Lactifluus subvellereus]|nr:hypothetical protein BJV78DRAFT_1247584 [Lactifluus subvellereus]
MHPDGTPQAEPFLSLLLNCDWRNRGERDSITRFIGALRNCLKSLEKYYDGLAQVDVPPASDTVTVRGAKRRAPYLCQYTSLNKEPVEFEYLELLIGGRMVFKAEELHTGRRVIVKFAQRYGKEAHQILARSDAAPELLGVDELADEWKMITMELLPSDKWVLLEDLSREERQQYQDKVREAVLRLHAGDQVHGDVRACNIFVPKSGNGDDIQVKFIDFDEAGPPGDTKYPPYWNTESVTRPDDVFEGSALQKDHDRFMVDQIFAGISHKSGTGIMRAPWGACLPAQ